MSSQPSQMMCDTGVSYGVNRSTIKSSMSSMLSSSVPSHVDPAMSNSSTAKPVVRPDSARAMNNDSITFKVKRQKPVLANKPVVVDTPVVDNASTTAIKLLINNEAEFEKLKQDIEKNAAATVDEKHVLSHLGDYSEEPYHLIESYFRGQHLERLVRHQIESYNHFINYQIQRTIQMFNPVNIRSENDFVEERGQYFLEVFISLENFKLYPPQIHENNGATKVMLPQEAKLRNFTYASNMTVDVQIKYVVRNTEAMDTPRIILKTLPKINIGKMPIMLKSSICVLTQNKHIDPHVTGECWMDCGGYFIVKGSEKTVLGQERAAENRIYCFDGKNTAKWNWFAEIKSVPDFKCISPKQIEMMIASKNNGFGHGIFVTIPRVKQPVELFVLFRALGIVSDKEICQYIMLDIESDKQKELVACLQASVIDANKYLTTEDALRHLTSMVAYTPINMDKETGIRKKREFMVEVLNNDLFPHCQTLSQKIYLIGHMAKKLIQTSLGWLPPDDRDSYLNKRIELTGTLLNNLFRNYLNKMVKEMQKQIVREINTGSWRSTEDYENIVNMTNIYKIMKSTTIENGITRALSTGDFSIKQANSSKVGVAQVLNRLTYVASLSHLRRINTPLEKSGELIAPRKLHNTTFGFLCLTGDVEVLMSNRLNIKQIKDMKDGDRVTTVNPETLFDEPSDIHSFFCKMPDKLFEITTISGRKIKATANHPFLINNDGKYEWKNLEDLKTNDKVIIRHAVKNIVDSNTTCVQINDADVLDYYKMDLLELNLLNKNIPVYKLKIIARLIGSLNTDGHLCERNDPNKKYYNASFYVGEEADVFQLADDISALGFGNVSIHRKTSHFEDKISSRITTYRTWEVAKNGSFAYLMVLLGGFVGKKTNMSRCVPDWLFTSELSIKREFLSAFQGGDGSRLAYQKNDKTWRPHIGITFQTTHNEYLEDTVKYMTQVVNMFQDFEINANIKTTIVDDNKTKVCIVFDNSSKNLVTYADVINYTYCEEKRRTSASIIEHLKIKEFNKNLRDEHYQYIIDNHKNVNITDLINKTNLTENQIRKVISKNKKGVRQTARFTTDIIYENFIKENMIHNGCVSVPILSINEIEPELVYDFTTRSDNHSFVASSFVCHNCPAETPEGQSIGVVKNLSYMAHLTIPTNSSSLYEYVLPHILKVDDAVPAQLFGKVKVFVNGAWVGVSDEPMELYNDMKDKKYKGIINIYTSVVFDFKLLEIRICNDGGRLARPVLRVKDNKALLTQDIVDKIVSKELGWNDLLTNCRIPDSVIEYIDPEEQNLSMIAMKAKDGFLKDPSLKINYTHCEIHPSTIFGVLVSCIPFPEHNQAPRNTYQAAMGKQAIGVYATNFDQRMDKTAYVLSYPGRPLVDTRLMNFIQLNQIPSGHQIHVAIMTHTGYNQEDSVLVNKGSIDRGLFMATIYHTEKDEDKNIIRDEIIRCKPDKSKTKGIKFGNYDKLNQHGFIPENSLVENRDVIIAKIIPIKENRNDPTKIIKYEDQSKTFRTTEETYIDKNYTGRNGDGYNFAKVRVRITRKPVLGDKFSSRHGQKGTCGNIIPECDMPFTKNGLRPDIIINPHAIPSRMTIAQLKETLLGKILLELGMFGDGTSFGNLDIKTIASELQKLGYESYGNEVMYNGLTGEQLETSIFIGPVFYQRLKHMVNDKQHSRSIGPMVNLTRQPAEGRSRDGGFRIGEMERDVMIAHGMSKFCRERMYDVSDKYSVHVCKKCGMIASYNDGTKNRMYANADFTIHLCKTCNNTTDFARVEVPYAYKLMAQELQTINIVPRLITE
jgi:DNA-directed RNA polymerase beta subunit/intein/homing endonuclease